jgi:bacillithiol system protein YtxJ
VERELKELTDLAQLEQVLTGSSEKPLLIFKHSNACPISSRAFDEFQQHLKTADKSKIDYCLIVVQHARNVSNAVAEQLGVEHESPQAILVQDKAARWHTSHGRITTSSLAAAVSAHAG